MPGSGTGGGAAGASRKNAPHTENAAAECGGTMKGADRAQTTHAAVTGLTRRGERRGETTTRRQSTRTVRTSLANLIQSGSAAPPRARLRPRADMILDRPCSSERNRPEIFSQRPYRRETTPFYLPAHSFLLQGRSLTPKEFLSAHLSPCTHHASNTQSVATSSTMSTKPNNTSLGNLRSSRPKAASESIASRSVSVSFRYVMARSCLERVFST